MNKKNLQTVLFCKLHKYIRKTDFFLRLKIYKGSDPLLVTIYNSIHSCYSEEQVFNFYPGVLQPEIN